MNKRYQAALFDMDGLLLDTEQVYTDVTNQIAGEYGKVYDWSIKQHCIGRDSRESAEIICTSLELPITGADYLRMRDPLLRASFTNVEAMPGAEALVRAIAAQGIPLALATSSNQEMFALKTQQHAWFSLFQATITSSHPDVSRAKPAPDIFLTAAKAINADPETCLVFEDAPSGLEAAKTAGMGCICVPDANMNTSAYHNPTAMLQSLEQVKMEEWF